ncbi:hypothetical protein [Oecophyllibacter saccharovorans]|uniref:hypothetical protein n=1 Tax=Oecophyllibacter saccharovorans TaxID=2558360 RepID=UPI001173AC5B|nr:hypothetical protein [Oecophyllibacter saccharovorans]TPW36587.1 hypothetical protein E3203_02155 [Oecophyllibacter saccharovorans]
MELSQIVHLKFSYAVNLTIIFLFIIQMILGSIAAYSCVKRKGFCPALAWVALCVMMPLFLPLLEIWPKARAENIPPKFIEYLAIAVTGVCSILAMFI